MGDQEFPLSTFTIG